MREEDHIRSLSKKIQTSHTTIAHQIIELEKKDIVDYCIKGRNKVYFLKKNIASNSMKLIVENYELVELVAQQPELNGLIKEIKENKKIKCAVLSGIIPSKNSKEKDVRNLFVLANKKKIEFFVKPTAFKINLKFGKYDHKKESSNNYVIIKGVEKHYEENGLFD